MTRLLRVGTDCSGIEAPLEALDQLGIPYVHVFSSEIDRHALTFLKFTRTPECLFGDVTDRDEATMPEVDLYFCGFPCQPFSKLNSKKRTDDTRRTVSQACIRYITAKQPMMFILENVLKFRTSDVYPQLMEELNDLGVYTIEDQVLNPIHYNCPQSRKRLFIVGMKKPVERVVWPERVPLTTTIDDIIDQSIPLENVRSAPPISPCYIRFLDAWKIPVETRGVIEFCATSARYRVPSSTSEVAISLAIPVRELHYAVHRHVSPCLVAHHPGLYVHHLSRRAHVHELLQLQGFRANTPISPRLTYLQLVKLIGNSMNVAVLKALIAANLR